MYCMYNYYDVSYDLHSVLIAGVLCIGSRLGPYQGKEVTGEEEGANTEGLWEVIIYYHIYIYVYIYIYTFYLK